MDAAARWVSTLGGSNGTDVQRPGKSTCRSTWQDELGVFEVLQIRGDALRSMGSSLEGKAILHAEEGVWLAERRMLAVFPPSSSQRSPAGAGSSTSSGACFLPVEVLHGLLARAGVPWECYRAYAELKRRSYVVKRRPVDTVGGAHDTPRAPKLSIFQPEPVAAAVSSDEGLPVAFHLYAPNSNFRKRDPGPPDLAVVVCRYNDSMPAHGALVRLAGDLAKMSTGMSRARRDQGLQAEEASGSGGEAGTQEELKRPGIMLAVVCLDGAVHLFDVGLADPDIRPGGTQGTGQQA